ncbi:MAG: leucyl/phenylalanyl-tRNA--protein transferase [Acidobacteria bacterium]|nr:leucyl/phenylalanyl-tRNA--protein transferase [Acidobacteriota bacterium]
MVSARPIHAATRRSSAGAALSFGICPPVGRHLTAGCTVSKPRRKWRSVRRPRYPADVTDWNTRPAPVGLARWSFPPSDAWPAQDVIAAGGDLAPATLISAYRSGLFPMTLEDLGGAIAWWSPDPRGILPLDNLRVTKSLRQSAKRYEVRVDTCFEAVILACGDPSRESGWITADFVDAYTELHRLGWAHSVEVFDREGRLAGGLYGVRVNRLFAGESMFYVQRDASKVALVALVGLMRSSGMSLLDVSPKPFSDSSASLTSFVGTSCGTAAPDQWVKP